MPPNNGTAIAQFVGTLVPVKSLCYFATFKHVVVPPNNGTAVAPFRNIASAYRWAVRILIVLILSATVHTTHEAVPPNNGTTTATVLYQLPVSTVIIICEAMPPNIGLTYILIIYYIMIIVIPVGQVI